MACCSWPQANTLPRISWGFYVLNPFKSTVYVRIRPDRMSVLHVESGGEYSDVPIIALEQKRGKNRVIGVGHEALANRPLPNVTLANGFKHPRTLIADFVVAEQTLKHFLKRALPKSFFAPSPVMILHPLEQLAGDLTPIEIRALAELGRGTGARKVWVWEGPELSSKDLHELRFARAGGRLLYP